MEETTKQLRERFLLLSCLTATQTENAPTVEALPPFFGFLLAVLETPPTCPSALFFRGVEMSHASRLFCARSPASDSGMN